MDVTRLTEDEQIALAIQMSMSQAESGSILFSLILFFIIKVFFSFLFQGTNDVEMKEAPPASSNTSTTNTQQTTKVIFIFLFLRRKK